MNMRKVNKVCVFESITSISNLLAAWREFRRGKNSKPDVALFGLELEKQIFELHSELVSGTYRHAPYTDFYVCDPKRRHIHKACVRDRIVQQAIYRVLYKVYDNHFIYDSFSSRLGKGTHRGVERLERACRKITRNNKSVAHALKCDIRKFFDSIDHQTLKGILYKKVTDTRTRKLIETLLNSFEKSSGAGLPLGNVTSQLFANIYLNEFDQFVKHTFKYQYYLRYADDFVILHVDKKVLLNILRQCALFLKQKLGLQVHPHKVEIRKIASGVDFLGYVVLPHYKRLRTKTRNRIVGKLKKDALGEQSLISYMGVVTYARERKVQIVIQNAKNKLQQLSN
jgi:RNA-directed DNA polymerase